MNKRSNFSLVMNLLGIAKPLAPVLIITVVLGVIGFLVSIAITFLGGIGLLMFLDEIPQNYKAVFIGVILLAVSRGALRYGEQYTGHYLAFRVLAIIRDRIYTALRRLSPAKLEGKDKGNLIAIITTDIELLEVFFAHTIAPVCIAFITSVIILATVWQYNHESALIILIGYIITAIVIPKLITKLGEKDGKEFRAGFGELSSYVMESLKGIRESMQYDATAKRMQGMEKLTENIEGTNERLKRYEELTKALCDLTIISVGVAVFFYTMSTYVKGVGNLSSVIIPTILALSSFGPVVTLSNLSNNLLQTFSSGHRVLDLLEEEPQVQENETGTIAKYSDITVKNIEFAYDNKQIFKNKSMLLEKNKIIGILGQSGSGKSTLLKLIMRFWDVNKGQIYIENANVKDIQTRSLRDIQGYVTQETMLFKGTIADNIKIAKENATIEEVIEAAKKASIHEFIEDLPEKYDTQIDEAINSLSAGEKQRISMARAFLHDAPILLLDEPTSNLDSLNEAVILKTIQKESKNKTVILVSHRKSTLAVADNIFAIPE